MALGEKLVGRTGTSHGTLRSLKCDELNENSEFLPWNIKGIVSNRTKVAFYAFVV